MSRLVCTVALAIVLYCAGCASIERQRLEDQHAYRSDGVPQGPFRGRWWNYYAWGNWYLTQGRFDEAERDLRTALALRPNDQTWARTYGLHLVPEYFPNRELGILLYLQGNFPEARPLLERSCREVLTARGADYLARLRRLEAAERDTAPPAIALIPPTDSTSGVSRQVTVRVTDDTYVEHVTIAGEPIDVLLPEQELTLASKVTLGPGQNTILVSAIDLAGNAHEELLVLQNDIDGPQVYFEHPRIAPGKIRGTLRDPAGIAAFSILNQPVKLEPAGQDAVRFELELLPPELDTPPAFSARDALGNVTQGIVPLDAAAFPAAALSERFAEADLLDDFTFRFAGSASATPLMFAQRIRSGLEIAFSNVFQGLRIYQPEIAVSIHARSDTNIDLLLLNDKRFDFESATDVLASRRLALLPGENQITVKAHDVNGAESESSVTVFYDDYIFSAPEHELSAALFYGSKSDSPSDAATFVHDLLLHDEVFDARFNLLNRNVLADILTEYQLMLLNGEVPPDLATADIFFTLDVTPRPTEKVVELVLNATDISSNVIAGRIDVSYPYAGTETAETLATADLRAATELLALRARQHFPRAAAPLLGELTGNSVAFEMNRFHGLKKDLPCLVFRFPRPGETFSPLDVRCEGRIATVGDRPGVPSRATVSLLVPAASPGEIAGPEYHLLLR